MVADMQVRLHSSLLACGRGGYNGRKKRFHISQMNLSSVSLY